MSPLAVLIKQLNYQDMSASDILSELNNKKHVVKNNSQQTLAALTPILSQEEQEIVSTTFKAAAAQSNAMADYRELLLDPGLNWADDRFQSNIDLLAIVGEWSDELKERVKGVGVKYYNDLEINGYSGDVTEQSISNSLLEIEQSNSQSFLMNMLASAYNEAFEKIQDGTIVDWSDVVTFFQEV